MIGTFRKMRWKDDGHGQRENMYKILFLKKAKMMLCRKPGLILGDNIVVDLR
jgi:hypothetical protein